MYLYFNLLRLVSYPPPRCMVPRKVVKIPVFRIRIHLIRIRIPHFRLNRYPIQPRKKLIISSFWCEGSHTGHMFFSLHTSPVFRLRIRPEINRVRGFGSRWGIRFRVHEDKSNPQKSEEFLCYLVLGVLLGGRRRFLYGSLKALHKGLRKKMFTNDRQCCGSGSWSVCFWASRIRIRIL